ncbi:histidine phosphatase family protein [Bacillus sp. MUM 116]|uniref:histidine phosphatase family protein n=1 Tax=Bacillus sp. MUM 116 TaxID=1678002 RepID=UPI0008F5EBCE|nr:histidine phosphatase family protein [Bacillus sp. MUM 116]OIK14156.1 histidine phosphatase family protein [Bacillus sp. MUM 116]
MDDCVVIALFRHGLTEANKRKAYLGWKDSTLSPEAMKILPMRAYDACFSSDLQRCVKTAKLLFPNSNPQRFEEFREINFGKWDGKTYEDLKEDSLYRQWLSDPLRYCPPDGESFRQFQERLQVGWGKIVAEIFRQNLKSSSVITHGGVIRYLLSRYAPIKKEFWEWHSSHTQGYELIFSREALRRGERCTLLQAVPLTEKENG